jgi:hypothetical protein
MTEERSKILDKAKKIKELADRGVDGEQNSAKDMLARYMEKHNLTIEEIEGHSSSNSSYANMSDEQFMREVLNEFLVLGIGYLISKLLKKDTEFTNGNAFNSFSTKYTDAVKNRTNKKRT